MPFLSLERAETALFMSFITSVNNTIIQPIMILACVCVCVSKQACENLRVFYTGKDVILKTYRALVCVCEREKNKIIKQIT